MENHKYCKKVLSLDQNLTKRVESPCVYLCTKAFVSLATKVQKFVEKLRCVFELLQQRSRPSLKSQKCFPNCAIAIVEAESHLIPIVINNMPHVDYVNPAGLKLDPHRDCKFKSLSLSFALE